MEKNHLFMPFIPVQRVIITLKEGWNFQWIRQMERTTGRILFTNPAGFTGEYLYNNGWNGTVTCYNTITGAEIWTHRQDPGTAILHHRFASDGKIYIVDDKGMVNVLKAGPEYILLAENPLGEESMVAPAITENIIFSGQLII